MAGLKLFTLLCLLTVLLHYKCKGFEEDSSDTCEPITIPLCKDIGYNVTQFPNSLGHQTQTDAGLDVQTYHPLVKINCSPFIQLFLCSLYIPPCIEHDKLVPPCREVCEEARNGCKPVMERFGHQWPQHMSCNSFPSQFSGAQCISPGGVTTPAVVTTSDGVTTQAAENEVSTSDAEVITTPSEVKRSDTCEEITEPLCEGIGYNMTSLPNLLNQTTQADASYLLQTYRPLLLTACSPHLQFFLCSVFLPVCTILSNPIPPCRELCEDAKYGCSPILERIGFNWPDVLKCDQFPSVTHQQLCLSPTGYRQTARTTTSSRTSLATTAIPKVTDRFLKRRLVFQAQYNFSCNELADVAVQSAVRKSIDFSSIHINELCRKECRKARKRTKVSCYNDLMTVTWPTNLIYSAQVTKIPADIKLKLTNQLLAKGTIMVIFVPTNTSFTIYSPVKNFNGSSARMMLQPFCRKRRRYNSRTQTCQRS